MSDTDSDVTIEPDPSDWDHSPNLFTPSPPQSVSKRQSSYHQLSDSDNEEPCSSVKQSFQHQTTEDLSNGRSSPKLLKRINKSSLSKSPSSSSQKNEKSIVFGKIDDQNNSAKDKKLDASKGVPQKKLHDSQVLKRKHSSGESVQRGFQKQSLLKLYLHVNMALNVTGKTLITSRNFPILVSIQMLLHVYFGSWIFLILFVIFCFDIRYVLECLDAFTSVV